jgi:hypothetical protein
MSNQQHRGKRTHRKERGSALLVTLMVMVGLSLLGLGFVAISETESTISANQRNYTQVLSVAEAGARLVVEWFQDPVWAAAAGLLPANTNAIKNPRVFTAAAPFPLTSTTNRYKDTAPIGLLFDKPFKPKPQDRFYGSENNPDIIINDTTAPGPPTFLTTFNNAISSDTGAWPNGQVTEIRIYAPPMAGDVLLNVNGVYDKGTRYGLCTIRVTAKKFMGTQAVAERTVKIVISEWPFPGPQGPVQSNANISTGGNFGVHWGKMTSDKQMEIKRPLYGLPWNDPWERIHFEHGYYTSGSDSNGNPNPGGSFCDGSDWLYKLYDVPFEDPWYEARAKTQITNPIATPGVAQPFKFDLAANNITANGPGTYTGFSNWFQLQNVDDPAGACGGRDHKLVIFPKIDYEFWKNLSQSAATTVSGVHYLKAAGGEDYTDGIITKSFAKWVNTARATAPAKAGFYFFDTKNGLNPQGAAPPGVLADPINVSSSAQDDGPIFKMMGFIYLNTTEFGTQGIRGPDAYYNFPGEPFRDVGYQRVDMTLVPPNYAPESPTNTIGEFDFQDINGNGVCDIFLAQQTVTDPGGRLPMTIYLPVKWFLNCVPGFNGAAGATCSEPHEPFLNLEYPSTACCSGGGAPSLLTAHWQDPALPTRLSKVKDAGGNPVACNAALLVPPTDKAGNPLPGPEVPDRTCTSNGYDRDGPLVPNFGTAPNTKAIMDGVLYNEGNYDTQGDAAYFGSILINGNIIGTGSPEVWFDEFLVKGGWQDKFTDLPRVYITSHQTDQ